MLALLVMVAVLGIASAPAAATARSVSGEAQLTPAQAPTAKPAVTVTNTTHGTSADLLPFSGVDLAFAVLVAGGLVLLGAALRRLSAGQSQN